MANLRLLPLLAALTTLTAFGSTAHASFPAGVWGLVDEVTLIIEPNMKEPTMVRIDGLFIVANQKPDFDKYPGYGEPQSGYMYYNCSEKEISTCLMEWKELQAIAGSEDNCRGWGDNSLPDNGKVYAGPQLPLIPDLYPLGVGVVQGFSPCEALKAWALENPGTTTGDESSSSSSTGGDATSGTAGPDETAGTTAGDATGGTVGPGETETDGGGTASTHSTHTSDVTGSDPETGNVATEGGTAGPTEGGTHTSAAESTAASTGESSSGAETGAADDDKGCACNSAGDPARDLPAALMTLLGLGLLRRRRA